MRSHKTKIEPEVVLDALVDGAIMIDASGTISLFNNACKRLFGYSSDEVIGGNVKMLMPQPYQREHDGYLKAYSETGVKKIIGIGREVKGLKKDGSQFPMDLSIAETQIDGKPVFIGIVRDLTRRHAQQRKYDKLQKEHFHLSRVSSMNEMGSAIAHELNQPLAASINYLDTVLLLLNRNEEIDRDELSNIASRAAEQAQRASEIISRMRQFIERGDTEKTAVDLKSVVETAKRFSLFGFDGDDITLKMDIPETLPMVLINSIQIQQVFVNLIRNACEAVIGRQERLIEITAEVASCGEMIDVKIQDTGHGLSKSTIETLFVPFSSKKAGGMGIGLSISQSIINHHGGEIWATKNEPNGSVFHFSLPIAESAKT